MHACIDKIYRKAKAKSRALLRCRRFFSTLDMLVLFKAHVRSQVEWVYGAIYHAVPTKLAWLDAIQSSFLRHLDLSEDFAFSRYNLAPWKLRRDIGMLGVLWKISHGKAHSDMCSLFPLCARSANVRTRRDHRRHSRQFVDFCDGTQLSQFSRSLFGLVKVWNFLPAEFVDCKSVEIFQRKLTQAAKTACQDGIECWQRMYSVDSAPFRLILRYCFV